MENNQQNNMQNAWRLGKFENIIFRALRFLGMNKCIATFFKIIKGSNPTIEEPKRMQGIHLVFNVSYPSLSDCIPYINKIPELQKISRQEALIYNLPKCIERSDRDVDYLCKKLEDRLSGNWEESCDLSLMEKTEKALESIANKGYPSAQLRYADYLKICAAVTGQEHRLKKAKELYHSVFQNVYAKDWQRDKAKKSLKRSEMKKYTELTHFSDLNNITTRKTSKMPLTQRVKEIEFEKVKIGQQIPFLKEVARRCPDRYIGAFSDILKFVRGQGINDETLSYRATNYCQAYQHYMRKKQDDLSKKIAVIGMLLYMEAYYKKRQLDKKKQPLVSMQIKILGSLLHSYQKN